MAKGQSVDRTRNNASELQKREPRDLAKDPTYIEPFILPKFEKQA